ncbi:MAG: glycosyltransferase family 4 protein [Chloroflexota bacterium]|nr:glycosyltransferase family 4 protein [Chloroflexota bacterium]
MRILVLVIQFPPDVNPSGLLMAQLGEGLVARGHQVSVITSFPHYAKFRVSDEFRGKLFERDSYRGMDVLRLYVYASGDKRSMKHRLLSYLSFNVLATVAAAASRQRYDVILCSNGSFFSGIAATLIGLVKGTPFIYNVQDLYPETPVQAGQLRNRFAVRVLEWLERFMYSRAAHISVIAPGFRDNIVAKDVPPTKVSTIPNFVDAEFIRPLDKANEFSHRYGLRHKFVVTHAGNVGYVYDLETLVEAASLLQSQPDVHFLIVGDGVARPSLEARVRSHELTNVTFLPYQPRETLPFLRATSDVQVALYKKGASRYSMPSKVYEIMASGRPVLASADPHTDLWNLVANTHCGICLEPHDPTSLASAVMTLYRDPKLRLRMGLQGRTEVKRRYSVGAVVDQYEELIRSVNARRHAGARLLEQQAWH